jgi:hypothetical protein
MQWLRGNGRDPVRGRYSDRAIKTWPASVLVMLAGAVGAALCSLTHFVVPTAAPLLCGFGVLIAMFGAVYFLVHRLRWVEPMALVKSTYRVGFLFIVAFFATRTFLGLAPLPGLDPNFSWFLLLVIALVAPLLLLFPIALAIGDGPPPVDESRLDEPPHL